MPSLTVELLRRFEDADNELRAIAAEASQGSTPGFEDLLGPFDAVSAMIRSLPGLRSGEGWAHRFNALGVALEAAREIHSRGIGLALSVIAERSQIQGDFQTLDGFCSAVPELDDPANLTVATLNYDGLLTAGFLQEGIYPDWTVRRTLYTSDMGDGRTEEEIKPHFAEGRSPSNMASASRAGLYGRARDLASTN